MFGIVAQFPAFLIQDGQGAFAEVQGRHYGFPDSFGVFRGRFQPVHHELDEMGFVPVYHGYFRQIVKFPVYAHLGVSPPSELFEKFLVMTFTSPDKRGEEIAFLPGIAVHYEGYYLFVRIPCHFLSRSGRISLGCLGVQKSQKIIYFRYCPHCRTGIVAGGFLFYGNDGAQPGDALHFRLFQYAHELFGVGRQGIHIPSLALCVDGVECQGRFPAAAQSRYDHELVSWYRQRNVFKVMGPCSLYFYIFCLCRHDAYDYTALSLPL